MEITISVSLTKDELEEQVKKLLKVGAHFGHKTDRWNPKMLPYLFTVKDGTHIFDLIKTYGFLKQACAFCVKASGDQQKFLFVGTKKQASAIIATEAERCGAFYVHYRWLGGMLTNWRTLRGRLKTLQKFERFEREGVIQNLPKKEASKLLRELSKLRQRFMGIKNMFRVPEVVYLVDQQYEITALKEAMTLKLPTICILDSNANPDLVTMGIPANDDAITSIQYITRKLADSIIQGSRTEKN